jgi:hypothetical protein
VSLREVRLHVVTALFAIIQAQIALGDKKPRLAGRLKALHEMLHDLHQELRKS